MTAEKKYNFEYFVLNESFQNWVNGKADDEQILFWEEFERKNPHKKDQIQGAKAFVLRIKNLYGHPDQKQIEDSWKTLKNRIEKDDSVSKERPINIDSSKASRHYSSILKLAAAVSLLLISFFVLYSIVIQPGESDWKVYKTDFNEVVDLSLPDGTLVQMNSDTELKIKATKFNRELKLLKGEVFFTVTKSNKNEQFKVFTEDLNIEVLGTEFNVDLRNDETKVMLKEGSVKLDLNTGQEVLMKPGEMATLTSDDVFRMKEVNTYQYEAWRDKKLVFKNTSLKEVADLIENHYGVNVILDKSVEDRTLTGEIPNHDLGLLIRTLEMVHELEISQEENFVKISE